MHLLRQVHRTEMRKVTENVLMKEAQKAHQHLLVKSIKENEQTTLHKNQEKSCQKSNSCNCWYVPERAKFKAPSGCRFGDNCAYKHTAKPADEKNSTSIAVRTAYTLHLKKHIQRYLNGQNPESFENSVIFMSMFDEKERQKLPKKWLHLRPNSSQDTGASWGPRQKILGRTEIPTNLQVNGRFLHCGWLTHSQRQSHHRFEIRGKEEEITPSDVHTNILKRDQIGNHSPWMTIEFATGMIPKTWHPHREERKKKSKSTNNHCAKNNGKCHKLKRLVAENHCE